MQFAARKSRLHQRRGVDRAFRAARAHHLVNLVDEDDHLARRALDLVHHRLQSLFELAPELRPRDHSAHVQRQKPLVLKVLGNVPGGDLLRETLGDRRLADASLADDHRIVLRAPVQHLHHALDLVLAAYYGVELGLPRRLRQIDAVALQRAVLRLRRRAVDARAATHLLKRLVDALLVDAELLQYAHRLSLALICDRDQDVLDAHVFVLQPLGLGVRRLEHPHDPRSRVDLHHVILELRRLRKRPRHRFPQSVAVRAQLLHKPRHNPALVLQQREEDMLHVPLRMPFCAYELLALRQHLLRAFCESVLSHHWSFTSISLVCDREHGASNSRCLHPGLFPMFPVPGSWLLIVYRRQHPVSVRLQLRPQALHFLFHLTDALVHADDNFDPGEVHPKVLDQPLDVPQSRHIRMRIQSLPSVRPARLDKADALVVAQALGMQTHHPRRYADNVARLLILSLVIVLHLYITASKSRPVAYRP